MGRQASLYAKRGNRVEKSRGSNYVGIEIR